MEFGEQVHIPPTIPYTFPFILQLSSSNIFALYYLQNPHCPLDHLSCPDQPILENVKKDSGHSEGFPPEIK